MGMGDIALMSVKILEASTDRLLAIGSAIKRNHGAGKGISGHQEDFI